jgi:hypothetical protein
LRLFVVALLIASIAFVGFRLTAKHAEERRLASIAGEIAHRDVSIRCQGRVGELVDVDGEYGFVRFGADGSPADDARLDRRICTSLARLARGDGVTVDAGSLAVEALAHESYHLAGVQDEGATQCYALQAMRFVAKRLGASAEVGDAFVRAAVARYPGLPEAYRSAECREGGALDLHPETGVFP